MKKTISILTLVFSSFIVNAQIQVLEKPATIEVGKIKAGMYLIANMSYSIYNSGDTTYTLIYRNAKYTQIDDYKTFSFNSTNGEFEQFYNLFKKAFTADDIKNYSITFKLGEEMLNLVGYKQMGVKGVMVITTKGATNPLTENQINKLFGK